MHAITIEHTIQAATLPGPRRCTIRAGSQKVGIADQTSRGTAWLRSWWAAGLLRDGEQSIAGALALRVDDGERRLVGTLRRREEHEHLACVDIALIGWHVAATLQPRRDSPQRLAFGAAHADRRIGVRRATGVDELLLDLRAARAALGGKLRARIAAGLHPFGALACEARRIFEWRRGQRRAARLPPRPPPRPAA